MAKQIARYTVKGAPIVSSTGEIARYDQIIITDEGASNRIIAETSNNLKAALKDITESIRFKGKWLPNEIYGVDEYASYEYEGAIGYFSKIIAENPSPIRSGGALMADTNYAIVDTGDNRNWSSLGLGTAISPDTPLIEGDEYVITATGNATLAQWQAVFSKSDDSELTAGDIDSGDIVKVKGTQGGNFSAAPFGLARLVVAADVGDAITPSSSEIAAFTSINFPGSASVIVTPFSDMTHWGPAVKHIGSMPVRSTSTALTNTVQIGVIENGIMQAISLETLKTFLGQAAFPQDWGTVEGDIVADSTSTTGWRYASGVNRSSGSGKVNGEEAPEPPSSSPPRQPDRRAPQRSGNPSGQAEEDVMLPPTMNPSTNQMG